MKLRHDILSIILIMLSMIFPASIAYSAPATATMDVNVRSGPGTNYLVVDTLKAGEQVNSTRCENGWCYIVKAGQNGWVFEKYLRMGGPQRPDPIFQNPPFKFNQPQTGQPQLPWPFQPAQPNQPDQPGQSGQPVAKPFAFPKIPAQPPQFPWPIKPRPAPLGFPDPNSQGPNPSPYQVCFYDGENFTAPSKCVNSGRSFSRLGPKWNNTISSLTIQPGGRVTLCQRANFQQCRGFTEAIE